MKRAERERVVSKIVYALRMLGLGNLDPGSMDFKVAVQKVAYLLQTIEGIDLGIEFRWLSRGPYSRYLANLYGVIAKKLVDGELVFEEDMVKLHNLVMRVQEAVPIKDKVLLLEMISSLAMMCKDVYPPPQDPVAELVKRKPYLDRTAVAEIWKILSELGVCPSSLS